MLGLIRSLKNTFVLVNRTPSEILTLIPDYWEDDEREKYSIGLTHVCRGWRELFSSRSSLWTRLDCKRVDKTRAYIERSKSAPLEMRFRDHPSLRCCKEALLLAVPHIGRLKALTVSAGDEATTQVLIEHFSRPLPLLRTLMIDLRHDSTPTLPGTLFGGDLSSLRVLSLAGALMPLSWRGLGNLTTFNLFYIPGEKILLTHLLDLFESASRLRHIYLHRSIPNSSDVPPERLVPLPYLKELKIVARPAHSILLNHLSIPSGALVDLAFTFNGASFPIQTHIPETLDNFRNLSHVTAVNLCFGPDQRALQLDGPSGELYALGTWVRESAEPHAGATRLLHALTRFDTSRCQWLSVTQYVSRPGSSAIVAARPIYQLLLLMRDLQTLTLIHSCSLPFIFALNPNKNSSGTITCPKLEEIIFYVRRPNLFYIDQLLSMVEERALRGAKFSAITIVSTDALAPTKEVFQLRKHVSCVECKFDDAPPEWDALPS